MTIDVKDFKPLRLSDGTIINNYKQTIIIPGTDKIFGGTAWLSPYRLDELTKAGIGYKLYINEKPYGGKYFDVIQGVALETDESYTETYNVEPKSEWLNDLPALRNDVVNIVKSRATEFIVSNSDLRWQVERYMCTLIEDAAPTDITPETLLFRKQVLKVVEDYETAINAATTFEDILAVDMPLEMNLEELNRVKMVVIPS